MRSISTPATRARIWSSGVAVRDQGGLSGTGELRTQAMKSLRRASELQPDSVRAWRELGSVLMAWGRTTTDSTRSTASSSSTRPTRERWGRWRGRCLSTGAQFDEAASWFERALAANPKAGWYALQLAHCAALLRDFVRGEAAASRAIELQQAALSGQEGVLIVGASMRLGHLRALQGRTAEAIAAYMQELAFLSDIDHALRNRVIVELNVRLGAAHLSLGETRKGRALLDVAIDAFDRRVASVPTRPSPRYYAAAGHALVGDADTAVAFLERAATAQRASRSSGHASSRNSAALRKDVRLQRLLDKTRQTH